MKACSVVWVAIAAVSYAEQPLQLPLSGRTGPSGSATVVQSPAPGVITSVNTLNPAVQVQGSYAGSITGQPGAEPLQLSLLDAIRRGTEFNLAAAGVANALRQSRGQAAVSRSALLPNVSALLRETLQRTNLRAMGLRSPLLPAAVGPFNYFDLRATLSQTVYDGAALNNYRAAKEASAAAEHIAGDTRDTVVLAVAGAYLQTAAAEARVGVAKAQLDTARAIFDQASAMNREGVLATVDVNRSRVQMQAQEQRVITLANDAEKQKLNLARMIGLAPGQPLALADTIAFTAFEPPPLEEALRQASRSRADLRAAEAQVRAAERARAAARSERLPSLSVSGDYGVIGVNPAQSTGTYSLTGVLRIPVWQGGRTEGAIEQASAVLDQRRAELADLRGRMDAEIRAALIDLGSAASQQRVALESRDVARESLELTRQRFDAGVADTAEVVRAQEILETAEYDVVASAFSHNVARAALARAMGDTARRIVQMLGLR